MTDHNTTQRQEWLRDMQEPERESDSKTIWYAMLVIIVVAGAYGLSKDDMPTARIHIVTWNR